MSTIFDSTISNALKETLELIVTDRPSPAGGSTDVVPSRIPVLVQQEVRPVNTVPPVVGAVQTPPLRLYW